MGTKMRGEMKEQNFIPCVDASLSLSLICVYYSLVKEYP